MQRLKDFILIVFGVLLAIALMATGIIYFYNQQYPYLTVYPKTSPIAEKHQQQLVAAAKKRKELRVLTLDGGGIHGIMELYSLAYLEKKTGKPISQLFDVISGTSAGAIIATALVSPDKNGKPLFSAQSLLGYYSHTANGVFNTPLHHVILTVGGLLGPLYDIHNVHKKISALIPSNILLSDSLSLLVLYSFSISKPGVVRFVSWDLAQDYHHFSLSSLITAGIAIPGFFAAVSLQSRHHKTPNLYIDSAIAVDNPSWDALWTITNEFPHKKYILLSLGAGKNKYGIKKYNEHTQGVGYWMRKAILLSISSEITLSNYYLAQLYNAHVDLAYYLRIEPQPITESVCDQFNGSPHCLAIYRKLGENTVKQNQKQLDKLAYLLTHSN